MMLLIGMKMSFTKKPMKPIMKNPTDVAYAEFSKIAQATSVGFAIMGFIGFFVKLIFIPINNIIVGAS